MGKGKSVNHLFWDQSLPYLMDMLNIKLPCFQEQNILWKKTHNMLGLLCLNTNLLLILCFAFYFSQIHLVHLQMEVGLRKHGHMGTGKWRMVSKTWLCFVHVLLLNIKLPCFQEQNILWKTHNRLGLLCLNTNLLLILCVAPSSEGKGTRLIMFEVLRLIPTNMTSDNLFLNICNSFINHVRISMYYYMLRPLSHIIRH